MASVFGVQQPWWASQPLPQGWEAKLDPSQNRYFFVNHQTRNTQWDDPRIAYYSRQQQQQQQQQQHQDAARALNGNGVAAPGGSESPIEIAPLRPTCATCHTTTVMMAGGNCASCAMNKHSTSASTNETSLTNVSPIVLAKLTVSYPDAGKDVISAVLKQHHNKLEPAEAQLIRMGYKNQRVKKPSAKKPSAKKPTPTPAPQQQETEPNDYDFPMIDDDLTVPGWTTRRNRSSSEIRNQVFENLQKDFKHVPESELKRILTESEYSEARARSTLAMWQPKTLTPPASSTSSPQASVSPPSSLVDINISIVDQPVVVATPSRVVTPVTPASRSQTPASRSQTPASRSQTPASDTPVPERAPSHESVASRPSVATDSSNRTTAMGANPEIAKGPDRTLLRSWKTLSVGSDSSLACGPNRENTRGPQRESVMGPQTDCCVGPNHNILNGAMYRR